MSVPLSHYLHLDRCKGVRLTCLGCMAHRDLPVAAVAAKLEARGVGGLSTGIREVAKFVREPCPKCGGRRFETAPAF